MFTLGQLIAVSSQVCYIIKSAFILCMKIEKEVLRMELAEIRNELEKTTQQIKDFRGSL
ncbi:hypothetical protein PCORN_00910 [Listeria cornellensis FSL F6-0969]|uniref:Uncharacterized protein n=1 Tax=Listeria cornellensis FSL F6-0969 TaxID=1265820 RepID=W7BZA1_9LIST|nr:hypothetical protein PCORN_00910 [Listeria cornellensis FSL F6-0969]